VTTIISRLDKDVDVVLSGHTHAFSNAYLTNAGGNPVLLTQAYMYSKGYADIDLILDRATGEIVQKSAQIIPAYADQYPGTSPDPTASAFLAKDQKVVAPEVNRLIGVAAQNLTREKTPAGESVLGDLVADSQRASMKTDLAFMTNGGVRADQAKGNITWGNLYSIQPFANTVCSMTMTGEQIKRVLEQQWQEPLPPHNLAVSGLVYTYDAARPAGSKVTDVKIRGLPLDPKALYTVSVVDFLAGGGDGYTTFKEGQNITYGPVDVDALVAYVQSLPQPVNITIDSRINRIN
jgi:5'-nucleotidase